MKFYRLNKKTITTRTEWLIQFVYYECVQTYIHTYSMICMYVENAICVVTGLGEGSQTCCKKRKKMLILLPLVWPTDLTNRPTNQQTDHPSVVREPQILLLQHLPYFIVFKLVIPTTNKKVVAPSFRMQCMGMYVCIPTLRCCCSELLLLFLQYICIYRGVQIEHDVHSGSKKY